MIPPYLNPEVLTPGMQMLPWRPFFVRPADYQIVDGDTVRILAPKTRDAPRREEAFRIRLHNVDTPELLKPSGLDTVLTKAGITKHLVGAGEIVRDKMREWCKDRVILIDPHLESGDPKVDRYRRLLADIHVSGAPGPQFDLHKAWSFESTLVRTGFARRMDGLEPEMDPPILRSLRAYMAQTGPRREAPPDGRVSTGFGAPEL